MNLSGVLYKKIKKNLIFMTSWLLSVKAKNKPIKSRQKGVALMMALFFTALISFLLFEISKETLYESISASQNIHELRAYYAAKAGEDVSLLRIKAYQMIKSQIQSAGEMAKPFEAKANIIWEFPFMWPPILPDGAPLNAQNELKTTLSETFFKKVSYAPIIMDMGGLIDINNLDSPSKALADSTKELLLEMYRKEIQFNEDFSRKYNIDDITILLNNITDWMDEDQESLNGGAESSIYATRQLLNMPPNQHFKTLSELMLVEGMNEDLFKIIEGSITTLGNPGININAAEKEVLLTLDPRMTDEIVDELISRRQNLLDHGPFNESLFRDLIQEKLGDYGNFNPSKIPILYTAVANFKIESVGFSGKISKTVISHVYDQTELLETMVAGLKKKFEDQNQNNNSQNEPENPNQDPNQNPTQGPGATQNQPARVIPSGPPPVVYRKVI
jgi:general secretion pathway protein K